MEKKKEYYYRINLKYILFIYNFITISKYVFYGSSVYTEILDFIIDIVIDFVFMNINVIAIVLCINYALKEYKNILNEED